MKENNPTAREVFQNNLNYYMRERGIEQVQIVDALGITASTVSDWVNGKKYPRVDSMQQLHEKALKHQCFRGFSLAPHFQPLTAKHRFLPRFIAMMQVKMQVKPPATAGGPLRILSMPGACPTPSRGVRQK